MLPRVSNHCGVVGLANRQWLAAPIDLAHIILTITDNGGFPLVTTAAPHGLTGSGIAFTIAGNTIYNGSHDWTVASPTTVSLSAALYIGDGSGGTWSIG